MNLRVLFDQNIPRQLRKILKLHMVQTALQMGWSEIRNGDLLRNAEAAGFAVMVTGDQNLRYQQNLVGRTLAIVMLTNTRRLSVLEVADQVIAAVDSAFPGSFTVVEIPKRRKQIYVAASKLNDKD